MAIASADIARAQDTSAWTNSAGGEWNVDSNWVDSNGANGVPAAGTNADLSTFLSGNTVINYSQPMAAPSVAAVTIGNQSAGTTTTLNINAAGFVTDQGGSAAASITLNGGSALNISSTGVLLATNGGPVVISTNGVMNVNGSVTINAATDTATNAPLTLNAGGIVNISATGSLVITNSGRATVATDGTIALNGGGSFIMTNGSGSGLNLGVNANNNGAGLTNNGGTIILDQRLENRGRFSRVIMNGGLMQLATTGTNGIFESSNDQERPWLINGGTANLGDFVISRTLTGPGAGLVVSNGVVNLASLKVGNNASRAFAGIWGGVMTNTGTFTICDRTNGANSSDRRCQFLVRGGTVVSTTPEGIIVANQANIINSTLAIIGGILDINAGTVYAQGVTLVKDNTLTNAFGTLLLSGNGVLYLGPVGLVGNVGPANSSYAVTQSGGTLAAQANYNISANMSLSGTTPVIQAAGSDGAPHNITHGGIISGSGSLNKTGGGILQLNTNNTYSGNTMINAGTLALGATGSISNSPLVLVGSGSVFDVSAVGTYFLNNARTLSGSGSVSGNVSAASGAIINPGSNAVAGTLTFANNLSEQGGVVNHFELSGNPLGTSNDFTVVTGTFTLNNSNTVEIAGSISGGSVYRLIQYGTLVGDPTTLSLIGASGVLSNNAATKTIYLVSQSAIRGPTNITWVGNISANTWDLANHTNWLNNGSLDFFVTGDNVLFNSVGAANPNVNIVGNVGPSQVTVGAAANYTFSGSGSISGTGGLTKTNTGTLFITSTNSYTGATVISGGIVDVATLANGGVNSAIGSAPSAQANLILDGGTLRYSGASVGTDRGATFNSGGATLTVVSNTTVLTLNNLMTGPGSLTKSGIGTVTLAVSNNYAGGSIISAGTLAFANNNGAGSAGITNVGSTVRLNGQLVIDNVIDFSGNCTVELNNVGSGNASLRGAWSGNGNVLINFITQNTNQTFTIGGQGAGGGNMDAFTGTVSFGTNAGFFRLNNDNASFNFGSSNATFDVGTGTGILNQRNGGTTNNLGALTGGPSTGLAGRGNTGASGTTTFAIGGNNLSTVFAGMITNGAGSSPVAIIKVGTGTLTLTGTNVHTGDTTVSSGVLRIEGDNGTSSVFVNGGTLGGNGSIEGAVDIQTGGTLSPGDSVGQMTMTSSLQLDSGSTTVMELNKAAGTNDSIVGMSSLSYAGTLIVSNLSGTLAAGDTFTLFSSAAYGGTFDAITLPALKPGLKWDTSGLTNGTIQVVEGLKITSVFRQGGNLVFMGSNGLASGTYYVLTSTNLAVPISTWTPISTNTFNDDGTFGATNPIATNELKRFYIPQQVSP
jgi:autotransporter-associated beta strand protein